MMEKIVSAAEANRHFSQLLRGVRDGDSYVVTAHGRPVARLVPIGSDEDRKKDKAWKELLARLERQPVLNAGKWTRDELYDDDP